MSYTKGKWIVKNGYSVGVISTSDDQSYGMFCEIADVFGENAKEDAQMMAAAPAMYEALCEVKRLLICEYGNRGYEVNYGRVIEPAIKQAEGGE